MKLNPKNILFGNDEGKKGPVLLAVTPPRTGERTLLGVENLLQSIAVPGALLPGACRGHGRRDVDGPLPRRRRGARPTLGPLPPGPHPEA